MKFTTKDVIDNGVGTSLQGYVTTTRAALIETFGMPTFITDDEHDKVTTEWVIQFENGIIATVYDWKRYEEGAPALSEIYEWHIGGYNALANTPVSLS